MTDLGLPANPDIPEGAIDVRSYKGCGCHRCLKENKVVGSGGWPAANIMMVLCKACGNKRCPHATDHRLECTKSNEPGQKGSEYE